MVGRVGGDGGGGISVQRVVRLGPQPVLKDTVEKRDARHRASLGIERNCATLVAKLLGQAGGGRYVLY